MSSILDGRGGLPNGGLTLGSLGGGVDLGNTGINGGLGGGVAVGTNGSFPNTKVLDSVGGFLGSTATGASQIICALKGTCQGTTVIHQAPAAQKEKSSNGWIVGLLIGLPVLGFFGFFIYKLVSKKSN